MVQSADISLVCPAFNEADNLEPLLEEWDAVLASLRVPYEMIVVDDCSSDSTLNVLQSLMTRYESLRALRMTCRGGQSAALAAGFDAAQGRWIVTSDADLQNDPRDLPKMLEQAAGFDVVCGWRRDRRDPWIKRIVSRIANARRRRALNDGIQDTGCGLKLMRREVAQRVLRFNGMHRFFPALAQVEGFTVTEIPVNHRPRTRAASKYTFFNRLRKPIEDLRGVRWYRDRHIDTDAVEIARVAIAEPDCRLTEAA